MKKKKIYGKVLAPETHVRFFKHLFLPTILKITLIVTFINI